VKKVSLRHQVRTRKTNESELLMTCRKAIQPTSKLGSVVDPGEALTEPVYGQRGVRHGGSVSLVQALVRNVGTWCVDVKGEARPGGPRECESTDATRRDGTACSSDEASETMWSEGAVSLSQSQWPTGYGRSLWL
jgi:hypothetical protein